MTRNGECSSASRASPCGGEGRGGGTRHSPMSIALQKQALRTSIQNKRQSLSIKRKSEWDHAIFNRFITSSYFSHAKIIALYASLSYEVDTRLMISHAIDISHKKIVIPKVIGKTIQFFPISSLNDLTPGTYGINEPLFAKTPIPLSTINLIITPGIAFSTNGIRLGMGKGYYDHVLTNIAVPSLAFAYDFQILPEIPYTKNDQKVDIIMTPTKTYDLTHKSISSY